jgi:ABC-type dipeptide/oligopeptide/nickel transport system ATPase component
MKKIEIIFLENYSSFKKNEKISFNIESNLLILSGENGAGKSQLFKAIQKNSLKKQKQIYGQPQSNTQICRVEIDGVQIKNKEIVLKKIGDIATIFNPPQSVELSSRKIIANSLLNAFKNDQAPVNYENSYDEFKNKANGHIFNKQEDVLDFLQDDDLS